jgi:hypothetical protein
MKTGNIHAARHTAKVEVKLEEEDRRDNFFL